MLGDGDEIETISSDICATFSLNAGGMIGQNPASAHRAHLTPLNPKP